MNRRIDDLRDTLVSMVRDPHRIAMDHEKRLSHLEQRSSR